jgi:hypothetical protein
MNIKKIQGNSLWARITCEAWADIDTIWANFNGSWEIFNALGTSVGSGNLDRSITEGFMYVKVPTVTMAALTPGTYTLVTQITNTIQDYEEERQDRLTITKAELIP